MDDIIQFLIVVAGGIAAALLTQSKKKRQAPQTVPQAPPSDDDELDNNFGNEYSEENDDEPYCGPTCTGGCPSVTVEKVTLEVLPPSFLATQEGTRTTPSHTPPSRPHHRKETAEPAANPPKREKINLHSKQKARQAFLYSEIFRRKY